MGNIVSGVYRIYGNVDKYEQNLKEKDEAPQVFERVTKYWISNLGG